ncbi:glycosyl hydrolase [Lewinellaceae bacterium SD302]|nr:glycosyl hydrolase [Lewinellaceae bacterium SD302]
MRLPLSLLLLFFVGTATPSAQSSGRAGLLTSQSYDPDRYASLEFRNIGPFRGGRSAAVTGVPGKPLLYYFGATGGGVWRTKDGGQSWENISDGHFGGSIGAVAVSESDPNTIYVGGGEKTVRGNVSYGYGVWKTEDGGKNWSDMGLADSRHISRIRIHPRDKNLAYAAVMGDLFKSSETRGVYRTTDGGQNWERILFANADAGAVDLVMDPNNPNVLFASTWRIRRTPYSLESGGEGSSLWRSTDGGDNWEELKEKPGLPEGTWGINAVAVSPVDGNRIYSIIENKDGGVFVSNDGGDTWKKTNSDRNLRQRAWYYTRIYADPQDIDGVYVMNVSYQHSVDGGRSFKSKRAPHGDHHDLWIAPEDPERMIIGDDGGAQVTFDQGENWSTYHNQPTSQFYRVTTDNHFPYRIYGAQQDNSTVRIDHRGRGRYLGESNWESTAGGESAHIAPDPNNPDIVYGGSYGGFLTRYDHETGQRRGVNVWPDNPMGHGAEGMKYRFQWNFPIFFGAKNQLYATSNQVHRSTNEGQSWEIISPDLTRAEAEKLKSSGGPITQDNTSVEYYATIFAAAEDEKEPGVIWAASDDGLVHVTRNDGGDWTDVTPAAAPKYTMWNSVRVSPFDKGHVYLAGTQYKLGDYTPYLFKSTDYGQSWQRIDGGIPRDHFTRVLQPDHKRRGLLYAGTESGLYISFNDGKNWEPFQQNLPIVPITDLAWKNDNLIVATQGRSFWILDDLTPLHQLDDAVNTTDLQLYAPTRAYRMGGAGPDAKASKTAGMNHPGGVTFHYYLDEEIYTDTLEAKFHVISAANDTIRSWSTKGKGKDKLELEAGSHRLHWDLYYPGGTRVDGMILWWAGLGGPMAMPGKYTASLEYGDMMKTVPFEIAPDERVEASDADLKAQFDFMLEVRDKVSEAHQAIIDLRKVRSQINTFQGMLKGGYQSSNADENSELIAYGDSLTGRLTEVEEALYQTKNRSGQDPLNFPIRLNNKLAHLNSIAGIGSYRPTEQLYAVKEELTAAIDAELAKYRDTIEKMVPAYNEMVRKAKLDVILVPAEE